MSVAMLLTVVRIVSTKITCWPLIIRELPSANGVGDGDLDGVGAIVLLGVGVVVGVTEGLGEEDGVGVTLGDGVTLGVGEGDGLGVAVKKSRMNPVESSREVMLLPVAALASLMFSFSIPDCFSADLL